jgi:uncharacterized SAM-binding protein YcdF (DUF218 family)
MRKLILLVFLLLLINPYSLAWLAGLYVVDDGWQHADVVVPLRGDAEEQRIRTEEAASLVQKGAAPFLVLDTYAKPIWDQRQTELVQSYFENRGFPVSKMRVCENTADSTAEEAQALLDCFRQWGVHRVIIVTSEYHSRRTRFIFRKILAGTGVEAGVHALSIPEYWDAHWWRTRRWAKTFFGETTKTLWTWIEFSWRALRKPSGTAR